MAHHRFRALTLGFAFAANLCGQDATSTDPHARLVDGDPIAVESARRELAIAGPSAAKTDVLVRVLRSRDANRRAAAGWLLLRHGLAGDAVRTWLDEERDPLVLLPLVEHLPLATLMGIVVTARRFGDSEDVVREDAERDLRIRAFGRLVGEQGVDRQLWIDTVAGADADLALAAAVLAVEEVWPFPIAHFDGLSPKARLLVLEQLGVRPRDDVGAELDRIVAATDVPVAERLLALTAQRAEDWSLQDLESLVDAALAEDRDLRHAAEHASWLVPPKVAGRIVGEAHRRLLDGVEITPMLDLLRNVDSNGERHLVSLARELPDAQRDAIASWLARRSSPQLDVLVREALDGDYPLTPELLRRAAPYLDVPARRARVLGVLRTLTAAERAALGNLEVPGGIASDEQQLSAFDALCETGVYDPVLLDYALANPDEQPGRLGVFFRLPRGVVPSEAWREMLGRIDQRAAARFITELMREPLPKSVEAALVTRALSGAPAADVAAEACLRSGSAAVVAELWAQLDAERRSGVARALRQRGDELARRLLMAEPPDAEEIRFARLALGDRVVLDQLLDDPASWERAWLRRTSQIVPPLLVQADLDRLIERFDALDERTAVIVLGWIVARADLDDHGLGQRIYLATSRDLESEIRPVALRGILRSDAGRAAVRARIDAVVSSGLDDVAQDETYELIGTGPTPLDATTATLLARFLLVEPLTRPRTELAAALRIEAVPHEPRTQLAFQRLVRETTDVAPAAFALAMAEARAHAGFAMTSTARLLRLLEIFARDEVMRAQVAPLIAAAVLDVPDLDRGPHGPACQMLAERAEADGDLAGAATRWDEAAHWYRRASIPPLARRAFLGESFQMDRQLPSAWLAARAPLCRARAALAAGDRDAARSALKLAASRAFGDTRSETEVAELLAEIER